MKVTYLKESQLKYISSGAFGAYFKIKGKPLGIKFLEHISLTKNKKVPDRISLNSRAELRKLTKAFKRCPEYFPQPHGLGACIKKGSNTISVGYIMSHVEGMTASRYYRDKTNNYQLESYVNFITNLVAQNHGIILDDCHDENVIISKYKIPVFIDAGRLSFKSLKRKRRKQRKS